MDTAETAGTWGLWDRLAGEVCTWRQERRATSSKRDPEAGIRTLRTRIRGSCSVFAAKGSFLTSLSSLWLLRIWLLLTRVQYQHRFVTFFGWYDDDEDVYLAMQYFYHGDLSQHIKPSLPEEECRRIVAQILEGLQYMHDQDFAHRDLKPQASPYHFYFETCSQVY